MNLNSNDSEYSTKGFLDEFERENNAKTKPNATINTNNASMIIWSDYDQESNDDLLPNDIYSSLNETEYDETESNEEPGEHLKVQKVQRMNPGESKQLKYEWNGKYEQDEEGSILGHSLSNTFDFGPYENVNSKLSDFWDVNTKYIELSDDVLNAVHCIKRKSTEWCSCFGSSIVHKGQCKTWKIKILSRHNNGAANIANIVIGIVDKQQSKWKRGAFWMPPSFGYGFAGFSGKKMSGNRKNNGYGRQCKVNDVITMTLNAKNELIFKRNEEDYGVAFEVDRSVPRDYVLAVAFCNDQYDIQIYD